MLSGVSPCAICQRISPLFMSIAVIRPYGGFTSGRPRTARTPDVSVTAAPGARSAPASAPAPPLNRGPLVAMPWIQPKSPESLGSPGTRPRDTNVDCEKTYKMCVSGSYDPPGQFVPPLLIPDARVPSGPSILLTTGGVKIGPSLYLDTIFVASARNSGVKSIKSLTEDPWRS